MQDLCGGDFIRMSVSSAELLSISRAIRRDFAPYFSNAQSRARDVAAFTTQELRDIAQAIRQQFASHRTAEPQRLLLLQPAPGRFWLYWHYLPGALQVLPHWQIQLSLVTEPSAEPQPVQIDLTTPQGQQMVEVPEQCRQAGDWQAVLGTVAADQQFTPLLYSNTAQASEIDLHPVTDSSPQPLEHWIRQQPQWASSFAAFIPSET